MRRFINKEVKNYLLLGVIIVVSVFLVIYFYMWHRTYEKSQLSTPIINEYLGVIQYNELDDYLVENKDVVLYVSILGNEDIRDFEKKFRRLIVKNALNNSILYLDVTNELSNKKTNREIESRYGTDVPYIIVFKDGKVKSMFEIKENDYNIISLKDYFVSEGIIHD